MVHLHLFWQHVSDGKPKPTHIVICTVAIRVHLLMERLLMANTCALCSPSLSPVLTSFAGATAESVQALFCFLFDRWGIEYPLLLSFRYDSLPSCLYLTLASREREVLLVRLRQAGGIHVIQKGINKIMNSTGPTEAPTQPMYKPWVYS